MMPEVKAKEEEERRKREEERALLHDLIQVGVCWQAMTLSLVVLANRAWRCCSMTSYR